MTPEQLSPIDVAPSKSDIPQVLSSGQNFPRLTGAELQVFRQLLSGSAENPIPKSELRVSASLLSSLRAKLGGIGEIINVTSRGKRRTGWESTYYFSALDEIDHFELKLFVEERINAPNLSSLGDMVKVAAQKQGLDADSLSSDSNRYVRIRKKIIRIMGRLGIKPVMNMGNTFLYAEKDVSKILEITTPIKIRTNPSAKSSRVYLRLSSSDYQEDEDNRRLKFPEGLTPEEMQWLKLGVTTCLLSHLVVEGKEFENCSRQPLEIMKTFLNGTKKFDFDDVSENRLKEFLVCQTLIPTLEEFWDTKEEDFAPQNIRRLRKHLNQVKEKFSLEEVINITCRHFNAEIPEKYWLVQTKL